MPYQPTTNFKDNNGIDLGKKLVTKEYLLEVYGEVVESSAETGLTVSPGLWLWGLGNNGQLGNNSSQFTFPTPLTTLAGGTNWMQVSCGYNHTAAIKKDGTLWTWGLGTNGRLGLGNGYARYTPAQVGSGTDWKQVSCGGEHTAAVKTDGTLWVWGRNNLVQLGIINTTDRFAPVTTFAGGTNWKQVSCGSYHTTAIKTDGTLWVWGYSYYGRLGSGGNNASTPVTTFLGGTTWKQVDAGSAHTVAIKTDGTLWTWGYNFNGQLGINLSGSGTNRGTPVTTFLGGTNWKRASAGYSGIAAIKTDGTLWTWGLNDQGQLGINNTSNRSTPVTTFLGGTDWKEVSLGKGTAMGLKVDGTLWTWGFNGYGRLGINLNTNGGNRTTPVPVFSGGTSWKSVGDLSTSQHCAAIRSVNEI